MSETRGEGDRREAGLVAEIKSLRSQLAAARGLLKDVMAAHRNPDIGEYNECEKEPCQWCVGAQAVIDASRAAESSEQRTLLNPGMMFHGGNDFPQPVDAARAAGKT